MFVVFCVFVVAVLLKINKIIFKKIVKHWLFKRKCGLGQIGPLQLCGSWFFKKGGAGSAFQRAEPYSKIPHHKTGDPKLCTPTPWGAWAPIQGHHGKRAEHKAMEAVQELFIALCRGAVHSSMSNRNWKSRPCAASPCNISMDPGGGTCRVA